MLTVQSILIIDRITDIEIITEVRTVLYIHVVYNLILADIKTRVCLFLFPPVHCSDASG